MNKICLTLFSMFASLSVINGQQWIDKSYTYDSLINVTYGEAIDFGGKTDVLKMNIYTPVCPQGQTDIERPLCIFIHGGSFLAGSKDDPSILELCRQFAKRGYVTATISYRLGFIADDAAWNCNYPNYKCLFATDESEWYRAVYRAIQDGKGALRFLVNQHEMLKIDTANIFLVGESAGAFVANGVGLMDMEVERPLSTFQLNPAPKPNANTNNCIYTQDQVFGNTIERPDLCSIEGTLNPSSIQYTIKGIGNMYGGMFADLLKNIPSGKSKPFIYQFHQPCDLIVPIDSGNVYSGLSWCLSNGYNCYGIVNTIKVYGSRAIDGWNISQNYGYQIQTEYAGLNFPYTWFGTGGCLDQVNNACHAYDNFNVRTTNMAMEFANTITSPPPCQALNTTNFDQIKVNIWPNPATTHLMIDIGDIPSPTRLELFNLLGQLIYDQPLISGLNKINIEDQIIKGVYFVKISNQTNGIASRMMMKN